MWKPCVIALGLSCGGAPLVQPAPIAPASPSGLEITDTALGPITAKTPANLIALRAALSGYEVQPVNDNGLEFHVYKDGEKLFYVIPTDTGAVFNVHVVSPKITVANHSWKVGTPLKNAIELTMCDCWGGKPVCFKKGDHIAVAFDRGCGGLSEARNRRVLEGVTIQRTVWNPKPFGVDSDAGYGGHDYGSTNDNDPCAGGDPCGP